MQGKEPGGLLGCGFVGECACTSFRPTDTIFWELTLGHWLVARCVLDMWRTLCKHDTYLSFIVTSCLFHLELTRNGLHGWNSFIKQGKDHEPTRKKKHQEPVRTHSEPLNLVSSLALAHLRTRWPVVGNSVPHVHFSPSCSFAIWRSLGEGRPIGAVCSWQSPKDARWHFFSMMSMTVTWSWNFPIYIPPSMHAKALVRLPLSKPSIAFTRKKAHQDKDTETESKITSQKQGFKWKEQRLAQRVGQRWSENDGLQV